MLQRTSHVSTFNIDTVAFSSIVQIGDTNTINAVSNALAVQRESQQFFGKSLAYPIFVEPIPLPPIDENVTYEVYQENPFITVKNIDIIGISSSSFLHIGNINNVYLETRVKHIRQLSNKRD